MRVLLVPDRMGPLPVDAVADALAAGWALGAPRDALDVAPLSDGGPGLVAAAARSVAGEVVPTVAGGVPVTLFAAADGTVLVELAQAPGGPGRAPSSAPAAALVEAALALAPRRLVVGVGGLPAHDAGAGLLAELAGVAGGPRAALVAGGEALGTAGPEAAQALAAGLERAAGRFAGVELVVAVDTEVPLLGLHGASALLTVPGAGVLSLAPGEAQGLESGFGRWVHALGGALGPGRVRAAASARGAGAGGGVAFALGLLGGAARPGPHVLAELAGLAGRAAAADLVVTVSAELDPHSGHDSVLEACTHAAEPHALPVVLITGEALLGRREWAAQGLAGVYALGDGGEPWGELADPAGALAARATRVARTWSR